MASRIFTGGSLRSLDASLSGQKQTTKNKQPRVTGVFAGEREICRAKRFVPNRFASVLFNRVSAFPAGVLSPIGAISRSFLPKFSDGTDRAGGTD